MHTSDHKRPLRAPILEPRCKLEAVRAGAPRDAAEVTAAGAAPAAWFLGLATSPAEARR